MKNKAKELFITISIAIVFLVCAAIIVYLLTNQETPLPEHEAVYTAALGI